MTKFPKNISHRGAVHAVIYGKTAHRKAYRVVWKSAGRRLMKNFKSYGGDDGALQFAESLAKNQSIISGIHPLTWQPYQILVARPPVCIEFNSISWPREFITRFDAGCLNTTSVSSVSSVTLYTPSDCSVHSIEEALKVSVPGEVHANNHHLFVFARAIKALEMQEGKFTPKQLRDAFNQWHERAKKFLRRGQTHEQYLVEFLNAYRCAKHPLGASMTISKAWKLAKQEPYPDEALQFENLHLRLLVALCFQLQKLTGIEPFYLSSRTVAKLLKQETHTTAAKWLRVLCALQVIDEVEKGSTHRASRYKFVSHPKPKEEAL